MKKYLFLNLLFFSQNSFAITLGTTTYFHSNNFDVRDFGAKGDGITNDRLAIIKGATTCSANNGILYFPHGIYISTYSLPLVSNCAMVGDDKYLSTIRLPQSNITTMDFSLFEATGPISNLSMKNMGLVGNRSFQTTNFTNGGHDGFAIYIQSGPVNNVEFDNIYISSFGAVGSAKNSGGGAILIVPEGSDTTCSNIKCTNSFFGNNDKVSGFYLDAEVGTVGGGKNIFVEGNTFLGGGNNNAVYILGGFGNSISKRVTGVHIDGNNFQLTENVDSCVEVNGVSGFTINNNNYVFINSAVGQMALIRSDCANGSFSKNTVYSTSSDTAKPTLSLVSFNAGEHQDNIVIEGNTIQVSTAVLNVISILKGSRKIKFTNNIIFSTATTIARGISIGESEDVDISNNTFDNISLGISISEGTNPPTSRIKLTDNRINNCVTNGSAFIASTGGVFSLTNLEIERNTLTNPISIAGGATFISITPSTYTGNTLMNNKIFGSLSMTDNANAFFRISNNYGYNPLGASAITVGASPFTYAAGTIDETVYIYGGSVSDIKIDGVTVSSVSTQIELPAQSSTTVTYSVLPSMVRYKH